MAVYKNVQMKMADKLQFYGPIPRPIKRAFRKVVSVIGLENPVHLIWDDGTNMGRIEACSTFLGRYESSMWNASISVCLSQGANYYIEKRELLLDAPRLLPEILHHTTTIRGPESIATLEGVKLDKEKYPAGNILKAIRPEAQKYIKRLGLDDKLVELAEAAAGNDAYNEPWGIVHGDLHMENVFVNDNEVWVIDYGKTREGPPAIDYAAFEYDVRYRFLFPLLSSKVKHLMECPDKWLQTLIDCIGSFEDSIMTETEVPAWSELSGLDQGQHETFERALQTILKVRSSAFSQIYKGNERSYWLVLFLYLIRVVQCYHIEAGHEDGPVGTLWAALLAKKIYEPLSSEVPSPDSPL